MIADQTTIEAMHAKEHDCEGNYQRANQMNIDSMLKNENGFWGKKC